MKILALDFSTDHRSIAVVEGGGGQAPRVRASVQQTEGRETKSMNLLEQALETSGTDRAEIHRVAVGLGPGSYTGIRLSISLAQGWHLALPVELVGASSLETMAEQAQQDGQTGRLHLVVDAQRGECYSASYNLDLQPPELVQPLRILGPDQLRVLEQQTGQIAGPEIHRWFPGGLCLWPTAAGLGLMALRYPHRLTGPALEPVYLRATTFVPASPPRFKI